MNDARSPAGAAAVEIIAEKPGRHRLTIFGEFKRNTFVDKLIPDLNGNYCVTAHEMACERRAELRKLVRFSQLKSKSDRLPQIFLIL